MALISTMCCRAAISRSVGASKWLKSLYLQAAMPDFQDQYLFLAVLIAIISLAWKTSVMPRILFYR
jgi:hypothetical protein